MVSTHRSLPGLTGGTLVDPNLNDDDGNIKIFDGGTFVNTLNLGSGTSFGSSVLWGLEFGNGGTGSNGPASSPFFIVDPDDFRSIFGSITPVPGPASLALARLGRVLEFSFRRRLGRRG